MKQKKTVKKKMHKTADPTWDTQTYGNSSESPFNVDWIKYHNPTEGRDQIVFLYSDKKTKKIIKHRILQ